MHLTKAACAARGGLRRASAKGSPTKPVGLVYPPKESITEKNLLTGAAPAIFLHTARPVFNYTAQSRAVQNAAGYQMTAEQLITALGKRGIEISRKTLFTYRAADPGKAPAEFDAVGDWARFILERQIYEPGRTQAPEKREAKERRAMSRNGSEPSADDQNGEYSAGAERKERILRLRLGNQMRRTSLHLLSESVITVGECDAIMNHIRAAVSGEILKLPGSLAESLAGKDPAFIQLFLERAIHKSLEALSRPEIYFKTETEHGANGLGAVSGG